MQGGKREGGKGVGGKTGRSEEEEGRIMMSAGVGTTTREGWMVAKGRRGEVKQGRRGMEGGMVAKGRRGMGGEGWEMRRG